MPCFSAANFEGRAQYVGSFGNWYLSWAQTELIIICLFQIVCDTQVMIFGALTHLVIQMVHFGSKVVTWCIVHTTAYGWATSFTQIGTCSNLLTLVPSSMLLLGQFPAVLFTFPTVSENTTSRCSSACRCPTGLFSGANTTHFRLETASLLTLSMMARPCSKSGT